MLWLSKGNKYKRSYLTMSKNEMHPRFCGMCGNPLGNDDKFCDKCGHPVAPTTKGAEGTATGVTTLAKESMATGANPTPSRLSSSAKKQLKLPHQLGKIQLSSIKRNWLIGAGVVILIVGIFTYLHLQNNAKPSQQEIKSAEQQTSQPTASATSDQTSANSLWSAQQAKQLDEFIQSWSPTMHQSYEAYDGRHELSTATGPKYPKDLAREQVDGQTNQLGLSKDGNGKYAYNVVAIYNSNNSKRPLPSRITYFFCYHNGQPVVLVDETRDGEPSAHPTQNADVAANFNRIANAHK